MTAQCQFAVDRRAFHTDLIQSGTLLVDDHGVVSNADKDNRLSREFASHIATRLDVPSALKRADGQRSGNQFENACTTFIRSSFLKLDHLRPGRFSVEQVSNKDRNFIARFQQFAHLVALAEAAENNPILAASLGNDYSITPDIVVSRAPESDEMINQFSPLIDDSIATHASLRARYSPEPLLHASISCKWTLRSDRAQNARAEALNLIRNRKGRLPHAVVVTGEPLPSRLASLALGTGDIDCVYHFALPELQAAIEATNADDAREMLQIMVDGRRLKDISDLPLDLAV